MEALHSWLASRVEAWRSLAPTLDSLERTLVRVSRGEQW